MNSESMNDYNQFDFFETNSCLIAQVKIDLYDELLAQLQKAVLHYLKERNTIGVIIDVRSIQIMDSINLKDFINLAKMINLMGQEVVFIGFQPGVAAALTELPNLQLDAIVSSMNIEIAIQYLKRKHEIRSHL